MNEFAQILDRVGGNKNASKFPPQYQLIYIRHILMSSYGWMPYEAFRQLPAQEVIDLLYCISKENEQNTPKQGNKIRKHPGGIS
jgi:hypothetical protein